MTRFNIQPGRRSRASSLKAVLKRAINRLELHRTAEASRREMINLGEHMLQDLGLDAEGRPLPPTKLKTQIDEVGGDCDASPLRTPVWCDCNAS